MGWERGVVCPCGLPLQLTATYFAHLRLHQHSGWFPLGSSGIASNVVVVTELSSYSQIRKEASQLPESAWPPEPVARYTSALPNQTIPNQSTGGCNQFPLPSLLALFWLDTKLRPTASACCCMRYTLQMFLWRLQKATASKPIPARKINHMHICRTESAQHKL